MSNTLDELKALRGEGETVPEKMPVKAEAMVNRWENGVDHAGNPLEATGKRPDEGYPKRNEAELKRRKEAIIRTLEQGNPTKALELSLDALGLYDEASPLLRPANTGEAWKMAYKTYTKYANALCQAVHADDPVPQFDALMVELQGACDELGKIGVIGHYLQFAVMQACVTDVSAECSGKPPVLLNLAVSFDDR